MAIQGTAWEHQQALWRKEETNKRLGRQMVKIGDTGMSSKKWYMFSGENGQLLYNWEVTWNNEDAIVWGTENWPQERNGGRKRKEELSKSVSPASKRKKSTRQN